jgi:hypothetical protein
MLKQKIKQYLLPTRSERIHQAEILVYSCNNDQARRIVQDLVNIDIKTHACDAVNIYLLGFMYSDAKDVFPRYEQRVGKPLRADFSLESIEIEEHCALGTHSISFKASPVLYWFRSWFSNDAKRVDVSVDEIRVTNKNGIYHHSSADVKQSQLAYKRDTDNFVLHIESKGKEYAHSFASISSQQSYMLAGRLINGFGVKRLPSA